MGIMEVTVSRVISANARAYPDEVKRIQDAYDTWIIGNLDYRVTPKQNLITSPWDIIIELTYIFRCEEDAVAFKLRWV